MEEIIWSELTAVVLKRKKNLATFVIILAEQKR